MITKTSQMISVQLIRVINLIPRNQFFFSRNQPVKNIFFFFFFGGGGGGRGGGYMFVCFFSFSFTIL